ncbi:peritrophin-44-like [Hermetia illucens]|nr:peritrophin-44-like [Hermetia illucens]
MGKNSGEMVALAAFLITFFASLPRSGYCQNACINQASSTTTYVPNPTSCAAWIACSLGEVVETGICNSGYMFNPSSASCEPARNVNCPSSPVMNICQNQPDDSYVADPNNCHGYFHCANSVGSAGLCSSGYYFNSTLEVCVNDPSYECESNTPDVICSDVPNGTFLPDKTSCSGYYHCDNGQYIAGSCGNTLYFNPATGACDYPSNVQYSTSSTNGSEGSSTTAISVPYNYTGICGTTTDDSRFALDPANCTGYFYCKSPNDKAPTHGYCPIGLAFNSTSQECASASNVTCTIEPCVNRPVGYFAADDTSCSSFYYCSASGKKAGKCPPGYNFDVKNQNCNLPSVVPCRVRNAPDNNVNA